MSYLVLPTLFGDNAVFPKGLPICIYGKSDAEGEAEIALPDGTRSTASFVPVNGAFSVTLSPIDRYAEGATLTVRAGDAIYEAKNIAIGIVLLAAGQSNMEFMLKNAEKPFALYPSARMRFYTEAHALGEDLSDITKPASDFWYTADGKTEEEFSAVGYFVAEMLSRALSVTVGVVSCNQGASRIEAWLSPEAVKRSGVPFWEARYPDQRYPFNHDQWLHYNKYLNIASYTFSAVLWYQGESNTGFGEGEEYKKYLHELIAEWRAHNPNKDLPFYLVELAPFDSVLAGWDPKPLGEWAPVRDAILSATRTERGVFAVSLAEVATVAEVHPPNKHPVAEKLARAILTTKYGYDLVYTGPRFFSCQKEGNILTVTLTHAEGLAFLDKDGAPAPARDAYFHLADGSQVTADLTVQGDTLRARIPAGAIRFTLGYQNAPTHNLYNKEGYLASPFSLNLNETE